MILGVKMASLKRGYRLPLWVVFTLADDATGRLRGGERAAIAIQRALDAADGAGVLLSGVGVNCCAPGAVDAALADAACLGDCPAVTNAKEKRDQLESDLAATKLQGARRSSLAKERVKQLTKHEEDRVAAIAELKRRDSYQYGYGSAKLDAEEVYATIDSVSLRLPDVIGPRDNLGGFLDLVDAVGRGGADRHLRQNTRAKTGLR